MRKIYKILAAIVISATALTAALPSSAGVYADSNRATIADKKNDSTGSKDDGTGDDGSGESGASDSKDAGDGKDGGSGSSGSGATCTTHFLGLKAWYDGLVEETSDGKCEIKEIPNQGEDGADEELKKYIWTVVLNIVSSVLGVVGYLAIGFVIWGGVLYMTAQGDPNKVAKGKKTIVNTLIGLVIVMSASIISGAIAGIVSGANRSNSKSFFNDIFGTFFVWAGIIAVIMMVYGGMQYITSTGNPAGVQKAKTTILYAAVGLIVVILAGLIVGVVVNGI